MGHACHAVLTRHKERVGIRDVPVHNLHGKVGTGWSAAGGDGAFAVVHVKVVQTEMFKISNLILKRNPLLSTTSGTHFKIFY